MSTSPSSGHAEGKAEDHGLGTSEGKADLSAFHHQGRDDGTEEQQYLNSSIDEETEDILIKKYYNIGIAVAIDDGLMVPVIKEADAKEFMDLAVEIAEIDG